MSSSMNSPTNRCPAPARRLGSAALLCLALAATTAPVLAAAPVGVKLMVQPWNPLTDDDSVTTVFDSHDAVSAALTRTWAAIKPKLINSINARLQTPNLFAPGVTLYGVTINVSDPELSIAPDGQAGFIAKLVVRETTLSAKSTTPDIALGIGFGSYADPQCSLRFALDLNIRLAVTDNPARLLEARYAANDKPVLVHGFQAEAQNATCALGKFLASDVAKLFTGRDMWQWMTDEINNPMRPEYKALNDTIQRELDNALVPINAQLKAPAGYARLRVWVRNDKFVVLMGVRQLPLPARVGSVRGRLTIGDLHGLPLMITQCDQLRLTALVKTGPSPVLNAAGTEFGDPPMVAVGSLHGTALASATAGQGCDFTVDQLVPGFPNRLRFSYANPPRSVAHATRNPTIVYALQVRPVGWHFDKAVHPQPLINGLNLTLLADNVAASAYLDKARTAPYIDRGDPANIKPGLTERALTQQSNPAFSATSALQTGARLQTANPTAKLNGVEDRAIIIVGGKTQRAAEPNAAPAGTLANATRSSITAPQSPAQATPRWTSAATQKGDAVALNPQPLPPDPQPDPLPDPKATNAFKSSRGLAPR